MNYHSRKTSNSLLNTRPFAAASFTWLMPTQFHRSHHGIAGHRFEGSDPRRAQVGSARPRVQVQTAKRRIRPVARA